jgi:hypothetical protein
MGGACSRHRGVRSVHKILLGKPKDKRPLERPIRSLDDNIKMGLK